MSMLGPKKKKKEKEMPRECGPDVNQVLCSKVPEATSSASKLGPGNERLRKTFFASDGGGTGYETNSCMRISTTFMPPHRVYIALVFVSRHDQIAKKLPTFGTEIVTTFLNRKTNKNVDGILLCTHVKPLAWQLVTGLIANVMSDNRCCHNF